MVNSSWLCYFFQTRGPHSLGERPVPIRGRLGARPRSGRWAAGEWADFHLSSQPLPITHSRHHCLPSPPVGPSSDRKGSPGLSSSLLLKSPVQTQHHGHTLHSLIDFSMDISIQQLGHTCSVPGVVLAAERTWQRESPSSWNHGLGRERQTVDR